MIHRLKRHRRTLTARVADHAACRTRRPSRGEGPWCCGERAANVGRSGEHPRHTSGSRPAGRPHRPSRSSSSIASIIRFAGDSGDGMQLTGDRFTQETAALRQRPGRPCPTSPPRSGRPRARCPGVSSFQVHFADHDILTAGDAPDVLVAMNPAALRANLRRPPQGRDDHRRHPRLHRAATSPRPATPRTRSTDDDARRVRRSTRST